jgi:hypothetical protein
MYIAERPTSGKISVEHINLTGVRNTISVTSSSSSSMANLAGHGASAIMIDGNQCLIAGTNKPTSGSASFQTVIGILGPQCLKDNGSLNSSPAPELYAMTDTRTVTGTWYGYIIEQFVYDPD